MSKKTVLFDLDGTLLPMDQELFVNVYFGELAKKLEPHGYEPEKLIEAVWMGTRAMVKNDGTKTNEAAFWQDFTSRMGEKALEDLPLFDAFYRNEFDKAKAVCGYNLASRELVDWLREQNVRIVLATNPLFPSIATEKRMSWAGLRPELFELYTTYENSSYCKPNPKYYLEILDKLGLKPEECMMIGNDVGEDMIARELGMEVFLLTDCLLNPEGKDISQSPNGGFAELKAYLENNI